MRNRTGMFGSKDGNCFLYGCAGVVVVGLIGVVVTFFAIRAGFNHLKEQYTSDTGVELPTIEADEATVSRVDGWRSAVEAGEDQPALTLTQDDINVLIQHHPELDWLSDNVYVTIEGSDITGDMSLPLDEIPGFRGRYFNGSATFDLSVEDGRLYLYLAGASMNGEAVPEDVMVGFKGTNIVEDLNRDPEFQKLLENVESVTIENSVVTVVPSSGGAAEEAPVEAEAADEAA